MQEQTGTLWRIRRTEGPRGDHPPEGIVIPLQFLRGASGGEMTRKHFAPPAVRP